MRTPRGYDGTRRLPAMLFLHGRGGWRGSFQTPAYESQADVDGTVLVFWEGRYVPSIGALSTYYVDGVNGVPDESDVLACLADALAAFAIDPDRVHLVGFSQGGKGALLIGLKNPDRFASVSAGASPTDAFEGQLWSRDFPDFASAAGGEAAGATGRTLALWFGQSPRFLLANARNLPLALYHGTADDNVPDSVFLFPYRNTHHVADVPGFTDAHGRTLTLAELQAADPSGYPFKTTYPLGVGHDQTLVLSPAALSAFTLGKTRVKRPPRVVAQTFEAGEKSFYWLRLERLTPPDGTAAGVVGELAGGTLRLTPSASPAVTVDLPAAGLDSAGPIAIQVPAGSPMSLRLRGPLVASLHVLRDGRLLVEGRDYTRGVGDLTIPLDATGARLVVEPAPPAEVTETDLLVPALVDASGQQGARFRSAVVIANLSEAPATLEALFLGAPGRTALLSIPPFTTRRFGSGELFAALGVGTPAAGPLRLRAVAGEAGNVVASARVFNGEDGAGTYGLSFPVTTAGDSVLRAGGEATLFGGTPGHPSRTNVSLFAPFEDAAATLTVIAANGTAVRTVDVALARLSRTQLNDLAADVPAPAHLDLRVTSGRLQVYGVVVDNTPNNDSFRSPSLLRSTTSATPSGWTVPAVAAAPGRAGATFTSDLYLSAPDAAGGTAVPISIAFSPRGSEGRADALVPWGCGGRSAPAECRGGEGHVVTATTSLAPGATRVLEDVLGTLFPAEVPGAGTLRVTADGSDVRVFAVTRSDSPSGPACEEMPAVPDGNEITASAPAVFVGLTESAAARSNLVLVNRGAATTVTLSLLAEDGARGGVTVSLPADDVRQLDSVALLFGSAPVEAGALVVRPAAGGSLVASAVRIDNLTNDPAGLSPTPLSRAVSP